MPESPDQGPPHQAEPEPTESESTRSASSGAAIPLLPRVTAPTEVPGSDPADESSSASGPSGAGGSSEVTVSSVRLPRRQRTVAPLPWSVRRGTDGVPLRRWLPLGTVDSGVLGLVDPAALVQPADRDWSLDWWVRAEDRWHHPSMEAAVSQGAEDATAVLRTSIRVPGGEVTHRCAAAQVRAGAWSGVGVSVEVTNDSAVPVALVLALRPYRLDGQGRISTVELQPTAGADDRGADGSGVAGSAASRDGIVVRIDGTDVLLVDKRPARVAHGTPAEVATALARGSDEKLEGASEDLSARRWDASADDDLEVAFVFPLAHTATLRAALSYTEQQVAHRVGVKGPFKRARTVEPTLPVDIPELPSVTRGWGLHSGDDPAVTWVVEAAGEFITWSAAMLRVAGPTAVTAALDPTRANGAEEAVSGLTAICRALGSLPAGELHLAVAAALIRAQRFSGRVEVQRGQDATVALAWVVGPLLCGAHGARHAEELVGPMAKALRWLERHPDDQGASGDGSESLSVSHEALRRLAVGLSAVDQPDVAEAALGLADGMQGTAADRTDVDTGRLLRDVPAAMPGVRHLDGDEGPRGTGSTSGFDVADGFDVVDLADLRSELLASMVGDVARGPALFGLWASEWNGRPVEVHRVPTAWGVVSAAVRWHGESPALLWDILPWLGDTEGRTAPVVSTPGLSPGWSATGWSGDALLDGSPV